MAPEAPTGVDVELLPHAIDSPLQVAILDLGNDIQPLALQVQIAGEESAEMRGVCDTRATA